MEFKRCSRCGCFFTSNDDVCCNCLSKDKFEMSLVGSGVLQNIEQNKDLWEHLINKHLIK